MMIHLLFPGRHLLTTKFQEDYLWGVLRLPIHKLDLIGQKKWAPEEKLSTIVFAVTSFNQSNSRYNPIPFYERAMGLDRFAAQYKHSIGIKYQIIGIPHFNPTASFASFTLKEIAENSEGKEVLTPENTIVLCSTISLIEQYLELGFSILTAEHDYSTKSFSADTPIDLIKKIVAEGTSWNENKEIKGKLSKATLEMWEDFPNIPKNVLRLWKDPLLTESGSLTLERNYSTYAYDMGNEALIDLKYQDIKSHIKPGKIVDEGCADAALMVRLSKDFNDSDLIGIELTTEFTARCQERLRAGEFGGTFVHFHQRNLLHRIFENNTIDTTICNSTTHELWSYADQKNSLMDYLKKKYDQSTKGGRIIIRDVVGPTNKNDIIYLKLNDQDGSNSDVSKKCGSRDELSSHLKNLSTYSRFLRFAEDYLADMRSEGKRDDDTKINFSQETVNGQKYIVLKLKDAVEFMTRKDYFDNWKSELNEEFAFWDFEEWKEALTSVGFTVIENPNLPALSSKTYTSQWIVENRWKDKVELYRLKGNILELLPYPPTHMVLIGEKRDTQEDTQE